MSTDTRHPQYDDATLQAAIDEALQEMRQAHAATIDSTLLCHPQGRTSLCWPAEALARALLNRLPEPAQPWKLPEPPQGRQWHRTDWTEDMLPEGWRPLLLGEKRAAGDEYQYEGDPTWGLCQVYAEASAINKEFYRTRRPLPEIQPAQPPAEPWQPAVGDVVRLKSGGPEMTVMGAAKDFDDKPIAGELACMWANESNSNTIHAAPACLVSAKEVQP